MPDPSWLTTAHVVFVDAQTCALLRWPAGLWDSAKMATGNLQMQMFQDRVHVMLNTESMISTIWNSYHAVEMKL